MEERTQKQEAVAIFYSYARQDEKLRDRLEAHLGLLHKQGLITQWHSRLVTAGADSQQTINAHLISASIILLLISPDFLASDYCYSIEIQLALERHERGEAHVIPILLRPTDWESAPFAHLQCLPHNGRPVTKWPNRDEAFVEIARSIRELVKEISSLSDKNSHPFPLTARSILPPSQHEGDPRGVVSKSIAVPNKNFSATPHSLRRRSLNIFAWVVNLFTTSILFIILKLIPPIAAIPLIDYIQHHQLPSLIIAAGVVLFTLIGSLVAFRLIINNNQHRQHQHIPSWGFVSATSSISFVLCFALLLVILLRPPWCPGSLCLTPKILVATNTQGAHDDLMEIYFQTLQSSSFVISSDPAHYTLQNLPESIGAVLLDGSTSPTAYKVVVSVHSLQQGRFGIRIVQTSLVLEEIPSIPLPLNIWTPGFQLNYNSNPYRGVYNGQPAGDAVPTSYTIGLNGYVQLAPGEADNLDIQVVSYVPVALKFRVQVTYRVTNDSSLHVLTLPNIFEVIFSTRSNWHAYHFINGHFIAND